MESDDYSRKQNIVFEINMFTGLHIHFPEPVVKHLHGGAGVNGNPVIECDRADLLEQIADIGDVPASSSRIRRQQFHCGCPSGQNCRKYDLFLFPEVGDHVRHK